MILRELFYFNKSNQDMNDDSRYDPESDDSVMDKKDTRKIRLTLKQINKLRRASESHAIEQARDVELINKMYAAPPQAEA
jgi:site-specific recombinase XerD